MRRIPTSMSNASRPIAAFCWLASILGRSTSRSSWAQPSITDFAASRCGASGCWWLPASHPLAERDVVHWTDLRSERFLLPAADPGPEIQDMLLGRLAVSGVKPDIRMLQASRDTVLSVLGGNSGVSIVCEGSTGARYPDVLYRAIHGEQGPALTGHSGCWRDDNGNPTLRRFLGFVKARYALSFEFLPRFQ